MDYDSDEDASCYTVQESSFDYEEFDWENLTAADCNCSNLLHRYLSVCNGVCEPLALKHSDSSEVIILGLLYLCVFLVGTIGNALVIFVVNRFRRMRTVTNIFLAALSTADLCLIWICVPIMVKSYTFFSLLCLVKFKLNYCLRFVKFMSYAWFMGRFACYSVHYVQQFTCFCSVLTMTMISFER
uniref:G_PROTEIN_RECEP_F1_2 domain-containing protein n=1 Tax=Syphacia muris TaxID=451379 RepID=A0A0N5B1B3_9BILA